MTGPASRAGAPRAESKPAVARPLPLAEVSRSPAPAGNGAALLVPPAARTDGSFARRLVPPADLPLPAWAGEEVSEGADALCWKAAAGARLSPAEALKVWREADLFTLGMAADARTAAVKGDGVRTFVIDRIVSYTNACTAYCSFCAFYRPPGHAEVWTYDVATILSKVEELVAIGGTQVMMQGGLNPEVGIEYYEAAFRALKARFPGVAIHSLTATEVHDVAGKAGLSHEDALRRLMAAGLDGLPGGGAEILVERVRKVVSPLKNSGEVWKDVMRTAHRLGLPTTATMTYGHAEADWERIEHLRIVREIQDEAVARGGRGRFMAFIPWSMSPDHTPLEGRIAPATGEEYLRIMALGRLFLDNVENVQAGWITNGPKLGQLALSWGANDFGGVLMEELVVSATGLSAHITADKIARAIRQTGRRAAQRDTFYNVLRHWDQA